MTLTTNTSIKVSSILTAMLGADHVLLDEGIKGVEFNTVGQVKEITFAGGVVLGRLCKLGGKTSSQNPIWKRNDGGADFGYYEEVEGTNPQVPHKQEDKIGNAFRG